MNTWKNKYLFHKCSALTYSYHPSQRYFFFLNGKKKTAKTILSGLYLQQLTMLSLQLKPAETATVELHDFEDKVHPLTWLISPVIIYLLHIFPASQSINAASDRKELGKK